MARRRSKIRTEPVLPTANGFARVLVATDFSPRAERALWRSVRLPLRHGAELLVLHVIPKSVSGGGAGDQEEAATRAVNRVADRVRELAREMGRDDLEVRAELAHGTAHKEIARSCRADQVELCVIGRHGAGSAGGALVGSTAERLARESSVPLLVVTSAAGGPYQRLLAALDFKAIGHRVLGEALRLAPPNGGPVRVLHAYTHWAAPVLRRLAASSGRLRGAQDAEQRGHEFLAPWRSAGFNFDLILHDEDPRKAILSVAEAEQADLIAVGTSGRRGVQRFFLGSVAEAVLRQAGRDMLVVRARTGERPHPSPLPSREAHTDAYPEAIAPSP